MPGCHDWGRIWTNSACQCICIVGSSVQILGCTLQQSLLNPWDPKSATAQNPRCCVLIRCDQPVAHCVSTNPTVGPQHSSSSLSLSQIVSWAMHQQPVATPASTHTLSCKRQYSWQSSVPELTTARHNCKCPVPRNRSVSKWHAVCGRARCCCQFHQSCKHSIKVAACLK